MATEQVLDGIRVLDLSRLLPGPFLSMILADMGADVVKVEAPGIGDYLRPMPPARGGMSGRFLALNRNKRSLVLDLKSERGRSAFLSMVERADVVIESFRPGVMDRLGVGYDVLQGRNPAIVVCSISGYGQNGPYRQRAGHDLNYMGLSGALAMGGESERAPGMPGLQVADIAGGALWGVTAVLGALFGRQRSGSGAHLDISMTQGVLAMLAVEFGKLDFQPSLSPSRGNQELNGALACYRVYQTRDRKYLSVAALEPKFWLELNRAVGRKSDVSELVAPPDRQQAIAAELQAIFAEKTRDEWVEHLAEHDCCCEPVLELDEVENHPVHRAQKAFFEVDGGELGPVKQVRTPVGAPSAHRLAPRLGEHSRQVLGDYGFSDDEIDRILASDQ
ncbi:MAG: CoA transferase [Proteobacteria bacterium]|nr:CoA transferase [Pseudomonadota bacterium]